MSLDANELVRAVKRAAVDAVRAEAPVAVCFGTVTGVNPLQITVDQKKILGPAQIILTGRVMELAVEMTVDHETEAISHEHTVTGRAQEASAHSHAVTGTANSMEHSHPYKGRKSFTVHLGLNIGERVILLRCDGGQKYIVLDRWEEIE